MACLNPFFRFIDLFDKFWLLSMCLAFDPFLVMLDLFSPIKTNWDQYWSKVDILLPFLLLLTDFDKFSPILTLFQPVLGGLRIEGFWNEVIEDWVI